MRWLAWLVAFWAATGAAHAEWYEASGPNVRVFAEGRAADAQKLAEQIERFDAALRYVRNLPPGSTNPAGRLKVYVLRSVDSVAKLAGRASTAGFYVARPGGSMIFVPAKAGFGSNLDINAQVVLLHEYTHHFMFRNYANAYPAWLAEGYAEFHSTARFEDDGSVLFGMPADHRAWEIFAGERVPMAKLIDPMSNKLPMEAIYGRGWLLTHYLHFEETRKGQLGAYIRAVNAGKTGSDAGEAAFGDLRKLDRELDVYAKKRLTGLKVQAVAIKPGAVTLRTMGPAEAAAMPIHIVSTRGVDADQAKDLLPRARRALHPFSQDAFAQGVLAEAEFDAGNLDEAMAAATRAVAADPKARQGHVYQSMVLAAKARAAKDTSTETLRAIRAPLFKANRLDPDDPLPMMMLYQTYVETGRDVPPDASKAILYAQKLAPEVGELRMLAAAEYLGADNVDAARTLIAPLAYNAHGGGGEQMRAFMAALDAKDAARARKLLVDGPRKDAENKKD
ncbi:hypothetical protein [Sphingomonas sp. Y38-1Y]|uniref:hypothetical protein n=1 Tax=Sphingomonas sp. Y38-1Y TaxID=3078265 RepID=UPI0028E618A8|nr:hypothetical protein [Sphingomonas sp. Y38-1Y]